MEGKRGWLMFWVIACVSIGAAYVLYELQQSGQINAEFFLTTVLVVATTFYAFETRQTVAEMRRARQESIKPRLIVDLNWAAWHTTQITIRNVGPGAALEPNLRIVTHRNDGSAEGSIKEWRPGVIASGESHMFAPSISGAEERQYGLRLTL